MKPMFPAENTPKMFNSNVSNLALLIQDAVRRSPDALFGTDKVSVPMVEAFEKAKTLCSRMSGKIFKGQTVAFVGVTSEHYLISWMACQLQGVRTALINPHYPQELIKEMLLDLAPDAVASFDDVYLAPEHQGWISIDARNAWSGELVFTSGEFPSAAESLAVDVEEAYLAGFDCEGAEIACYMHTSGTSGRPKFCALSHAYFIRLGRFIADSMGYVRGDVVFAPMPMFHINPLGYGVVAAWTAGAGIMGTQRFVARDFWKTVKRIGATALVLHITPLQMLMKEADLNESAGHQVRVVFGAVSEFLEMFDVPMGVTAYGSTEAGGLCHSWHVRKGDAAMAEEGPTHYAGRARFDVEAKISEEGEILVRERACHTLFSGYLRDGILDRTTDLEGWFHTGDRGRIDPLGNLVFIERMSESIRVNGEYVPIDFVERSLETEAGLSEFAIWSRPDSISGQRVVLWIADARFDLERTLAAIRRLPGIMRPVEILQIAELPRDSGVSKIQRRRLHGEDVLWRHAISMQ